MTVKAQPVVEKVVDKPLIHDTDLSDNWDDEEIIKPSAKRQNKPSDDEELEDDDDPWI